MTITEGGMEALSAYSFPGNVRELRNLIERLVILTPDEKIDESDVKACLGTGAAPTPTGLFRTGVPFRVLIEEAERAIIEQAITHHNGHMSATARGLGMERSNLYKKCRTLGLRQDKYRRATRG